MVNCAKALQTNEQTDLRFYLKFFIFIYKIVRIGIASMHNGKKNDVKSQMYDKNK